MGNADLGNGAVFTGAGLVKCVCWFQVSVEWADPAESEGLV